MGRACGTYEEEVYKGFGIKSWGKMFAGSPRHRWEDNIRKGNVVECTGLMWLRVGRGGELFGMG